jgi:PAS domain S-box-containing protein
LEEMKKKEKMTKNTEKDTDSASDLRKRAEESLQYGMAEIEEMSDADVRKLFHELQVHQIELEMQNEELHKAQELLEESRTKYTDLYDFAPIGYFTFDRDGLILDVNLTGASLLGKDRKALIKKPFSLYINVEDKNIFCSHLRKVFESKTGQACELRLMRKGNSEFYAQLDTVLWKDSMDYNLYRTSVIDITERKQTEEKIKYDYHIQSTISSILRISLEPTSLEELLKRVLDVIIKIPWLTMQSKGCIYLVEDNPEMLVMKAQRGLSESLLASCAKIPFGKCLCGRTASTRKLIFVDCVNGLHEICYQDMLPHGHYCVPILSGGRILGVICLYIMEGHKGTQEEEEFLSAAANTLAGIIERKKAEEALKTSQAQLIQSDKMSSLGTMVAGVAHELINPLMAIINFIRYCQKKTSTDDKRFTYLQDAERATKRCITVVENLLTFSHMEKKGERGFLKGSCATLLDQVLKLLSYRIEKERVLVIKHYAEDIPDIWMKVNSIQQVFLNIITNALDALRESKKKEIYIDIYEEKEFVGVTIFDTGPGISTENFQRIFDPFFTTKPPGQGTGLGLSICQNIIQIHEGRITCKSNSGQGTTFEILLPIDMKKRRSQQDE